MRRNFLPLAIYGMLAATVGCAQHPTAPMVMGGAAVNAATSHVQADDPVAADPQRAASTMRRGSTMRSGRRTSGRRTSGRRTSARRGGKSVPKHHLDKTEIFLFKGVYLEKDSAQVGGKRAKLQTTNRRMESTKRRGGTTTTRRRQESTARRGGAHGLWNWM